MIFDKRAKTNKIFPRMKSMDAREGIPPKAMRKEMFSTPKEMFMSMLKGRKFTPSPDNRFPRPPAPARREPFAPSFRKDLKVIHQHQDKSHHVTSDPKNKVNLIQVFVNKPHNEAKAEPQHHHTMIKKHQFSRDYQPMPPRYGPPPPPYHPHSYHPAPRYQAPVYGPPRHVHYAHEHEDRYGDRYEHIHAHGMHHNHAPYYPPRYEQRFESNRADDRRQEPPHFYRPSTSYPRVSDPEPEVMHDQDEGQRTITNFTN